jgi:hypothetical protein
MIRKVLSSSIVLGIAGVSMSQFVPGRVVIMGPSSTANSNSYAIVARQLLPTRVNQTTSITDVSTLPSNVTMSGSATSEGHLSRSTLGRFLTFGAYAANTGIANMSGSSANTYPRVFGRLDFSGNLNTNSTLHYGTQLNAFGGSGIRAVSMTDTSTVPRIYATGGVTGLVYSTLGGTGSGTTVSSTNTNNRQSVIFGTSIFISSQSGSVGVLRVNGLPTTTGNTMATAINTTAGAETVTGVTSLCLTADAGATATTGNVYCYVAGTNGITKYTSTAGWEGAFQTAASPTATVPYKIFGSSTSAICAEGNVVYAISGGDVRAIWDGGSAASSFSVVLASAPSPTPRGIAMAPAPLVVNSVYSTGGAVTGNIMTLRNDNDFVNRYRVGIVPDTNSRGWTEFTTSPGVTHSGTVVASAVDSAGNTYLAIQSLTNIAGPALAPTVSIQKIPYGGGTIITSDSVQIPTQCEVFGIFVDDTNRPVVGLRGDANFLQARVVRWAADLTGGTLHGSTFFSTGSKVPVDICAEPGGYALISFGESGSYGWNSLAADFSISANNTATISADGANALTPISAKFGASDGFLRVMSAGTGANRALFRVDSLDAAKTSATSASRSYRRDGTAPGVSYTDNTASSPAYMLPWTMSMSNDGPKVLMLHTSEPNSGPAGPGVGTANRNDVYVGAGRIWSFNTNNVLAAPGSTYRFAPGIAPVN